MAAPKHRPTGKRRDGSHYLSDRTSCVRNHPFEGDNIIERHDPSHPGGGRMCRQCSRERGKLSSRVRTLSRKLAAMHDGSAEQNMCSECVRLWNLYGIALNQLNAWRSRAPGAMYDTALAVRRFNNPPKRAVASA